MPENPFDPMPSKEELTRLAWACYDNACLLLLDAQLLHREDRPARAVTLAILGLEELGKARLCYAQLHPFRGVRGGLTPKRFYQAFRYDHRERLVYGMKGVGFRDTDSSEQKILEDLAERLFGAGGAERFRAQGSKLKKLGKDGAEQRELSLYVDAKRKDGTFVISKPEKEIPRVQANVVVGELGRLLDEVGRELREHLGNR